MPVRKIQEEIEAVINEREGETAITVGDVLAVMSKLDHGMLLALQGRASIQANGPPKIPERLSRSRRERYHDPYL